MIRFPSKSTQRKLFHYGIIPSLCVCLNFHSLQAEDFPKKSSLIILEGRDQGLPDGTNLQQKLQFLTTLTNQQSERIHRLHEEVQHLKSRLHLAQLAVIPNETGSYKQLYISLKQKLKKEVEDLQTITQENVQYKQLYEALQQEIVQHENIHQELKGLLTQQNEEIRLEKQKAHDAENQIATLMGALKEQTQSLESIEESHKAYQENAEDRVIDYQDRYQELLSKLVHLYNNFEEEKTLSTIIESHQRQWMNRLEADLLISRQSINELTDLAKNLEDHQQQQQNHLQKAENLQKELEETQQLYNQTVAIYNEVYGDLLSAKKQIENLYQKLDENNIEHLAQKDDWELKIALHSQEFKDEQEKTQKLENQLDEALTAIHASKVLQVAHHHLQRENEEIKDAYLHYLEMSALQDNLLKETLGELDHAKRVNHEQAKILQDLYTEKHHLDNELSDQRAISQSNQQSILETNRSLKDYENSLAEKEKQIEELQTTLQELMAVKTQLTAQSETMTTEHQQDKSAFNQILAEKIAEIQHLNEHIYTSEKHLSNQLKELTDNLESEKSKNTLLDNELAEQHAIAQSNQQSILETNRTLKDYENSLAEKEKQIEELQAKLHELIAAKTHLTIQSEAITTQHQQDKSALNRIITDQVVEIRHLNEQIESAEKQIRNQLNELTANFENEKSKNKQLNSELAEQRYLLQSNQQSVIETNRSLKNHENTLTDLQAKLKEQIAENTLLKQQIEASKENTATIVQIERLQNALQQTLQEKTTLQTQYEDQIVAERLLMDKLENTLSELEEHKSKVKNLEKSLKKQR